MTWSIEETVPTTTRIPSRILHPNDTGLACGDRTLSAAMVRAIFATTLGEAAGVRLSEFVRSPC